MSILSSILSKTVTSLNPKDLTGVRKLMPDVLRGCNSLVYVNLPKTCEHIGHCAFYDCSHLNTVIIPESVNFISDSAFANCGINSITINNPNCIIRQNAFSGCTFYNNNTGNILAANGKILIKANSSTWPTGVTNLAGKSCDSLISNSSLTIPDYVIMLGDNPVSESITKITFGKNLSYFTTSSIPTSATTLIFKQSANTSITFPEPGDGTGVSYTKDARNVTIYTDNIDVKNYDWTTDNVTVTIYPLSQAPA